MSNRHVRRRDGLTHVSNSNFSNWPSGLESREIPLRTSQNVSQNSCFETVLGSFRPVLHLSDTRSERVVTLCSEHRLSAPSRVKTANYVKKAVPKQLLSRAARAVLEHVPGPQFLPQMSERAQTVVLTLNN